MNVLVIHGFTGRVQVSPNQPFTVTASSNPFFCHQCQFLGLEKLTHSIKDSIKLLADQLSVLVSNSLHRVRAKTL